MDISPRLLVYPSRFVNVKSKCRDDTITPVGLIWPAPIGSGVGIDLHAGSLSTGDADQHGSMSAAGA